MKNNKFAEYDVEYINNCMSLRPPQKRSLKILDNILDEVELDKNNDLSKVLEIVHDMFPTCSSFERDFFSISFALATGVGKTRLMGACIAYLYTVKGIKNFFIVAPNITIYNKLKLEFADINNPKYIFKGLSCFSTFPPNIIYGDNYQRAGFTYGVSDCTINIFNIDKFNKTIGEMKHLSEFIGDSYFNYLSNLKDLVVLMDESHHYRADKGMAALNELNPVLGLEFTATPQVEKGTKSIKFKNVVYEYPLSQAIKDGYTKIPYAMTRRDINIYNFGEEEIDKLMLSDGIINHERVKTALEVYANNNPEVKKVKPFMMVVCKDTKHAEDILKFIISNDFKEGKYKNKTIILHSNQKGLEKEENIKLLNEVEKFDNPIEIVIHVNILKEGWDVNNLYTIVPLRTAVSKTLREQIIGRGLRLPYGFRVNDVVVDSLVVAAHDKFEEIIKEAHDPNSLLRADKIIFAEDLSMDKSIISNANVHQQLQMRIEDCYNNFVNSSNFNLEEKEVIKNISYKINESLISAYKLKDAGLLNSKVVVDELIEDLKSDEDLADIVKKRTDFSDIINNFIKQEVDTRKNIIENSTMEIPIIRIEADGTSNYYFEDFELDCSNLNYSPIDNDVIYQNLINDEVINFKAKGIDFQALNPIQVLGYQLKNKSDVGDNSIDLLLKLIKTFLNHLAKKYDTDEIKHIVMFYKKDIANKIYEQMKSHYVQKELSFKEVVAGVTNEPIKPSYKVSVDTPMLSLYDNITDSEVSKSLFTGFKKALHEIYKFDSSPEKRFAIVCDNDDSIIKWLRPAPTQFKLFYNGGLRYEPDFVVETHDKMYLVEVKGENMLKNPDVIAKRDRAVAYCRVVNNSAENLNKKKWMHLFIPANEIKVTSSFKNLVERFVVNKLSTEK